MSFEIEYIEDQDYILTTFTGPITMAVVHKYIDALLPVLTDSGCQRLLSDSTHAQIQVTTMDILQFPAMAEASPLTSSLKRAALAPEGISGYEMYETFSKMQGQDVRVFNDRSEALEWLLSDAD